MLSTANKNEKHVYDISEKETWSLSTVNEAFRRETDRKKSVSCVFAFRIFFAPSHPATHTFKEPVERLPIQTVRLLCFLLRPHYHRRFTGTDDRKHDFLSCILWKLCYPVWIWSITVIQDGRLENEGSKEQVLPFIVSKKSPSVSLSVSLFVYLSLSLIWTLLREQSCIAQDGLKRGTQLMLVPDSPASVSPAPGLQPCATIPAFSSLF